jgi:hypothetical protein
MQLRIGATILTALCVLAVSPALDAGDQISATYRGLQPVVKFDISPPLRDIPPLPVTAGGEAMVDPEGPPGELGPQDIDPLVQGWTGAPELIPSPLLSFDGPSNLAGVSPPDPVGDVGPNHYVAMSNLYFQVYDKAGTSLYGPAANNTLWSGFGGDCQTDNAGDPIVLYDQIADRWMLTQFTSSGPTYFNCVAVSTTPDPTGSYYRWAVSTGSNFPDYPKYGVWPDAYYISTREFAGGSTFAGVGAYALKRADLISGNPALQVISFLATPAGSGGAYNVGDGLLPSDLDGSIPPPAGSPNYFVGAMDDGATYGAPDDAFTLWKFQADFVTPANSTFILTNTIPFADYDTIFPCSPSSRDCIPQPATSTKIDILSYRQRPMHRLAYRNFGSHEALVTNQSVEAAASMAGIRWWEIRDPNGTPVIYQEGTYAPGVSDGIHRWMGSIAQDNAGNMALGYSASNGTSTFPSSWYTGRLSGDPLGTMPQGEGSMINGTGSQTGSARWGDYTSMNIDPIDDCTFWYVNQYIPVTSSVGWQLRIGAFKFNECGTPDFYLASDPDAVQICAGSAAAYNLTVGSIAGFGNQVTLSASGNPAGTAAGFSANPVTPPGSSTLTISNTAGAAAGSYLITVSGTATGSLGHSIDVALDVFTLAPGAPTLVSPANGALNVPLQPTFSWTAAVQAATYLLEVDDDPGFGSPIIVQGGIPGTSVTPATSLASNTTYYWRVTAENLCGVGAASTVFSFTTEALPGDCGMGTVPVIAFTDDFESGAPGWTHSGTGDSWALSTARSYSPANSFHANDPATSSDQRLVSPPVVLPVGSSPLTLQFWNWQLMEDRTGGCYDGGLVEISTDDGATWTHLPNALMLTDPYDGPVTGLGNLDGWCDDLGAPSTIWKKAVVDIDAYAGQTARFRFRLGSDTSVSREGWYIDDVLVQSCELSGPSLPFEDGFESGDTTAWSNTVP